MARHLSGSVAMPYVVDKVSCRCLSCTCLYSTTPMLAPEKRAVFSIINEQRRTLCMVSVTCVKGGIFHVTTYQSSLVECGLSEVHLMNVQLSLSDCVLLPTADRPEWRATIASGEPPCSLESWRATTSIAALSETRIANEGQLTEDGGGYCFIWNGRTSEERREEGESFVIRSGVPPGKQAGKSTKRSQWPPIMVMQLQLTNKQKASLISALLNVDGATLTNDRPAILNRWAEYFSAVLNRPADINAEAIARMPQVETNTALDRPPSEEEVKKAIKQLSTGNAPGADAISAEVYKQAWWWHAATEVDRPFLPYVGWESHTSAAQKCGHHPPLQNGKSPALWQLQRNLSPGHNRKDIGTGYAQPPDSPLGTRPSYFQRVNAASEVAVDRWHDLRCPPTAGEMPRAVWRYLHNIHLDVTNWEVCAQDRPLWRSMIHTGARTAETNRIAEAQKKRAAGKARLYSTASTSAGPT